MMRQLAETVRTFVVRGVGALPATVDGRSGFDAAAVSHLEDVRDVLRGVRVATYALGLILSALLIWALVRKRALEIAAVLLIGGGVAAGAVALAAVAATTDFYTFFSAFHGLFFRAGTWTFPYDSLLIQLFPQPFWMVAGGVWAGLSAVLGAIAVIAGLVVRRSVRGAGA
jgi:integral membrane protein (TIGR01906 family)